jgi:hypothetical protein
VSFWRDALIAFALLITAYFVLWNVSQMAMTPLAAITLWRQRRSITSFSRTCISTTPAARGS